MSAEKRPRDERRRAVGHVHVLERGREQSNCCLQYENDRHRPARAPLDGVVHRHLAPAPAARVQVALHDTHSDPCTDAHTENDLSKKSRHRGGKRRTYKLLALSSGLRSPYNRRKSTGEGTAPERRHFMGAIGRQTSSLGSYLRMMREHGNL